VDDDDHSVVTYEADFDVPSGFGPIGAIIVTNELRQEMFLEDINLTASDGAGNSTVLPIRCNSWVQPKSVGDEGTPSKRIFFANKVLPPFYIISNFNFF
jgi:lipoxygenase